MRAPLSPPRFHTWTLSDGYRLHGRLWRPARRAGSSALLYLHGIQSHGGWFEWSASLLAESGSPVILPDRRGSGRNETARGDTPSMGRWLADLDELADWAAAEFGVARLGVLGVSWGGKLAVAWTLARPRRVAALLLIAPGLFPAVDLPARTKLRIGWSLLRGGRALFDIPLNDPALFTENPAGRAFIAADPLRLRQVSARFLWCSRRLDQEVAKIAPRGLPVPLTLLLAGRDRIIRNAPTAAWAGRAAAQAPTVHTFADAGHTLEFEADGREFEQRLRAWAGGSLSPQVRP